MVQGQADHQVARVAFMAELADTHGQEPLRAFGLREINTANGPDFVPASHVPVTNNN